jgi:hypothetical protein
MSNKPRITSEFSKLQLTPKFTDNQLIADRYILVCIFVCIFVHICVHFFRRCYTRFGAYPNCTQIKIFTKKNNLWEKKRKKKERATAQVGTNVRARVFNARLLPRSQFASGRSCDRPTRTRFSVVFLGPRANAQLIPKFYAARVHMQPSRW